MKAIYCRVSTSGQSNDPQLYELREYCQRRGWQSPVEFCDQISGTKFVRAGLDKLLQGVRTGRIDTLVVAKLDRLARSLTGLAMLLDELQRHGCALVVTGQGIDTSEDSPTARFQLAILGAVAAFERDLIAERTKAGLAAARANGKRLGRPNKLDQYKERVAALVAQAYGFRRVAKELGLPLGSASKLVRWVHERNRRKADNRSLPSADSDKSTHLARSCEISSRTGSVGETTGNR